MLGTIVYVVVVAVPSLFVWYLCLSPSPDGDHHSPLWPEIAFGAFFTIAVAIIMGVFFLAFVLSPARKVNIENTYQEYYEATMLVDYAEQRDAANLSPQEKSTIINVINSYNDHADFLRTHYDNLWYGIYIDDKVADLPAVPTPATLQP